MANANTQFTTLGPDAQVLGQAMDAFIQSINFTNFQAILSQYNLTKIEPQKWYPQQIWLDIFNEINASGNSTENLVSIGMKVIETAQYPPDFESWPIIRQITMMGEIYVINNRGADIGKITPEVVSDNHVIMHDSTPYPDDFIYGAYYALARRFTPAGSGFVVKFDENIPRRGQGGDVTLVHIMWD